MMDVNTGMIAIEKKKRVSISTRAISILVPLLVMFTPSSFGDHWNR